MKIRWHCGYYVGPMKWQGTEVYEPDECGTEFDTEVSEEEWIYGDATAICPRCGAELYQDDDEPWIIEEVAENHLPV